MISGSWAHMSCLLIKKLTISLFNRMLILLLSGITEIFTLIDSLVYEVIKKY